MATVWIPALLRDLTGGIQHASVAGQTLADIIDEMERLYPGIKARLCDDADAGGRIRPNIAVVVDGLRAGRGLRQPIGPSSEVHFVPAISGG
jgi:molybdopterin synthase sulfur carrier subunit